MTQDLPPPNPNASGLCLTAAEWSAVQELLRGEPTLQRVWIYGSRLKGVRTNPVSEPPDIDLAVDFGISELGDLIRASAALKERWQAHIAEYAIHIEVFESRARFAADQIAGRLLLDRTADRSNKPRSEPR